MNLIPRGFQFYSGRKALLIWKIVSDLSSKLIESNTEIIFLPLLCNSELYQNHWGFREHSLMKWNDENKSYNFRPEGTALIMKWLSQSDHFIQKKFFYFDSFYRYERPQQGRRREFYQFGYEWISKNSYVDINSLVLLIEVLSKYLNINNLKIELNYLGFKGKFYRIIEKLFPDNNDNTEYLHHKIDKGVLKISNYWHFFSNEEKSDLMNFIRSVNLTFKNKCKYIWNPSLTRGLHYYSRCVFEIKFKDRTIAGGGCYDGMLQEMNHRFKGYKNFGWALGIDRLVNLIEDENE